MEAQTFRKSCSLLLSWGQPAFPETLFDNNGKDSPLMWFSTTCEIEHPVSGAIAFSPHQHSLGSRNYWLSKCFSPNPLFPILIPCYCVTCPVFRAMPTLLWRSGQSNNVFVVPPSLGGCKRYWLLVAPQTV